jgi:hypothetical protein
MNVPTAAIAPLAAPSARRRWGRIVELVLLVGVVFLFWERQVFAPLRLLIVFFHEGSHALVAWSTGGQVRELVVNAREGGHVLAAGGNRFLTLNAGYLGSLLWGAAIYGAAATSRLDRIVMGVLAAAVAALSLSFAHGLYSHVFGLGTALAMALAARFLGPGWNDFLLRIIGLTSMVYVPHDIYSDTIARSSQLSDARMLAGEYGGATVLWGAAWFAVSVVIILFCLTASVKSDAGGRE